jgi:hypothetical protein
VQKSKKYAPPESPPKKGRELPRRVLVVQKGLEHAVFDNNHVAARRALVIDMDRQVGLAVRSAPAIVAEGDL